MDAALADATERGGKWLACKPGCAQCCQGVFAISQLDAERLRAGLQVADAAVAGRMRARVVEQVALLSVAFPGDVASGVVCAEDEAFEDFANDELCPVLDPVTQTCDLYAARPMTCRTFGPPVRSEGGGLSVCELCFVGASTETLAKCELVADEEFRGVEAELIAAAEARAGVRGETIVAFALRSA